VEAAIAAARMRAPSSFRAKGVARPPYPADPPAHFSAARMRAPSSSPQRPSIPSLRHRLTPPHPHRACLYRERPHRTRDRGAYSDPGLGTRDDHERLPAALSSYCYCVTSSRPAVGCTGERRGPVVGSRGEATFSGHVTPFAGQVTRLPGHVTPFSGQVTRFPGHVTSATA